MAARRSWAALALALPLAAKAGGEPLRPIEDNSFLVEEAYNQEAGVVQNISTFQRDRQTGSWTATFTQEWPAGGLDHQLSYTVSMARLAAPGGSSTGAGDTALHYRYQAVGTEGALALAPRASLLLPTGDAGRGLGAGGTGWQVMVPLSVRIGDWLVMHGNAGATWVPRGRAPSGESASSRGYCLGQSAIALLHPRLNLVVEALWSSTEQRSSSGSARTDSLVVGPGLRAGLDLPGGTQLVAGLSVPLGLGPSAGSAAVFGYFSVELPFTAPEPHRPM